MSHSTLKRFVGLRMIVLALAVGAGIMIVQLSAKDVSVGPLYVLLVLSYVVGGIFYGALRLGVSPVIGLWLLMVADVAVETAILHYSGGVTSQFSLIFCLTIIAAAYLLQVPGGLCTALLASLCYIGHGILEVKGFLTPSAFSSDTVVSTPDVLQTYMHVSLFFLVGAVGGYVGERGRQKGHALRSVESELEQLKVDTDNILKHMSSGVLVIDSEGQVLTVNPTAERILGVDRDEIVGKRATGVLDTLMPELSDELLKALGSEESKTRHEITVNRAGCRPLPLGISISFLRDDEDNKRGVIAVFQDLSEVRDMQDRVRKADRLAAIGELSAAIAHELRNPLASISGSIEMLATELDLDGENKRLMSLITKESDRLDRIISDFLEYARLRPPSKDKVVVAHCIEEMVMLLKNNPAVMNEVHIMVYHDRDDVVARFDEEQIKQVLLNLAINACEAMAYSGTLTIRTSATADGLWFVFKDEGEGVSDEARSRLYEPFFTTKEGGTGLGLAVANKIVEAHGGRIEVQNHEQGGAEFSVILPATTLAKSKSSYGVLSATT